MEEKKRKSKQEHDLEIITNALTSVDVAIENVDLFGRINHFRWPNGRHVVNFEEHKEVMKVLLYWKRETEVYKHLVIDKEEKKE
jgi:hypothetical protein